jgi:hypothetical protein
VSLQRPEHKKDYRGLITIMIRLIFGRDPLYRIILGPAGSFRIGGGFIYQGPNRVARYQRPYWEVQGRNFARFDCFDTTLIYFEDAAGGRSQSFGPFAHFWAVNGSLFTEGKLFAKYMEKTQLWHCYPAATDWPILAIVEPSELP